MNRHFKTFCQTGCEYQNFGEVLGKRRNHSQPVNEHLKARRTISSHRIDMTIHLTQALQVFQAEAAKYSYYDHFPTIFSSAPIR